MKKKLYMALSTALKRSPHIRWVDWQKNQFTHSEQSSALPLPAVLLDLKEFNWEDGIMDQQTGTMTLAVDVYMSSAAPAEEDTETQAEAQADDSPAEAQDEAENSTLKALALLDEISSTLQGFQSESVQGLSRSQETRLEVATDPNLLAYRLLFRSRVHERLQKDPSIQPKTLKLNTDGQISK